MNEPTIAEIIKYLRDEVVTMALLECEGVYLVTAAADRLETAEAKLTKISRYVNSTMDNAKCFAHINKTLKGNHTHD